MSIETTSIPDDLKQRLVDSLDKVAEWVRQAEVFAADQAPLVVQDILAWGWYGNIAPCIGLVVVSLAMMAVSALLAVAASRAFKSDNGNTAIPCTVVSVLLAIFMWFPLPFSFQHGMTALKVKEAPRVYILEKIGVLK